MTAPVKLSRERWEMLYAAKKSEWQNGCTLRLVAPFEIDGVIFLPAEYVPLDAHR